MDKQSDRVAIG